MLSRALLLMLSLTACVASTPEPAPHAEPADPPPPAEPPPPPLDHLGPGECTPIPRDPLAASHPRADDESTETACTPRDADTQRACTDLWNNLRAADIDAVPLTTRCRLAAALASTAVVALSEAQTTWWHNDDDVIHFVPLARPRSEGVHYLISPDESCPPAKSVYFFRELSRSDVTVEILGKVDRRINTDLALALDRPRPDQDACAASFSWPLNSWLGEVHPPRPIVNGRQLTLKPTTGSISAPAPRLVLDVIMEPSGDFTVERAALETGIYRPAYP